MFFVDLALVMPVPRGSRSRLCLFHVDLGHDVYSMI